ncbi:hypothetical protein [Candidatus Lokiarchaeum ossiferum]
MFSNQVVRQKMLVKYNQVNQSFFKLFIEYLSQHPEFLQQLGPTAQKLILRWTEDPFEVKHLLAIYDYYNLLTDELISRYLQGIPLSADLRERIVFEADMTDRQYLERELPSKDPLLLEIQKHDEIETPEFSILR